jgi:hypothetical protein
MNGQEKCRLGLPSGITLGIVKRDDDVIIYIKTKNKGKKICYKRKSKISLITYYQVALKSVMFAHTIL